MNTILIVEDDELIRQALQDILTPTGCRIVTAEDGKQGLSTALREHPDLVLLDFFMPVKSGLEVVQELRQDAWGKSAQVVMLTNNGDTAVMNEVLEYGVKDYLLKVDMSSEAILQLVRTKLSLV